MRSRIVPFIQLGAGVVTTRGDIHYVVTEHGVAYLHGKTMRERAMALISIAHPEFRAELLHAAKRRHLVYADQILPPIHPYPSHLESRYATKDGTKLLIRPIRPSYLRSPFGFSGPSGSKRSARFLVRMLTPPDCPIAFRSPPALFLSQSRRRLTVPGSLQPVRPAVP